jgi:hypothetical protein
MCQIRKLQNDGWLRVPGGVISPERLHCRPSSFSGYVGRPAVANQLGFGDTHKAIPVN